MFNNEKWNLFMYLNEVSYAAKHLFDLKHSKNSKGVKYCYNYK